MDSFAKRRPPKFTEPIDFNLKGNEYSYCNQLVDRFSGLFSSGWSTNDQNGGGNTIGSGHTGGHSGGGHTGGLYSSNLTHAINGINPFNTKGFNCDYNSQWIAPPRSCPPIGTRDPFNSFSITPRNLTNNNHQLNINNANNQINSPNYNTINSANQLNRENNFANLHQQSQRLTNPNNTNNSYGSNHLGMTNANNGHNKSLAANSSLNALQASYVPPRVRRRNPTCTECVFCKNNGHPPSFYKSHILKCPEGKIVCPVLRDYDCPICHNGGGEKAHTLRYCPWNKPSFWQRATRS